MKKSLLSIAVASTLLTSAANADFLGVEIGAAGWSPEMTGKFKYGSGTPTNMDLKDDLGFGNTESTNFMWLSFEHPVPIIPNAKIIQTSLELDASKVDAVSFAGKDFSGTITTNMTLNQTDYILYYEFSEGILIPFVHLDGGIAIKNLDGSIKLAGTVSGVADSSEKDFSVPVPMGYAKIKLSTSVIPFLPDVEYETLRLSIGDNSFEDTKMGIVYNFELGVGFDAGLVAGIRKETLKIDESSVKANIDIEGYYYGAYFNW